MEDVTQLLELIEDYSGTNRVIEPLSEIKADYGLIVKIGVGMLAFG